MSPPAVTRVLRFWLVATALGLALACSSEDQAERKAAADKPERIADQAGAVCGMLVRDQSAPRAQVVHRDGERAFVCSIGDLLVYLAAPSPHGAVMSVLVESMREDEDPAQTHVGEHAWVRAEEAHYVVGVKRSAIMGEPVMVYADAEVAARVAKRLGGRVRTFQALRNGQ